MGLLPSLLFFFSFCSFSASLCFSNLSLYVWCSFWATVDYLSFISPQVFIPFFLVFLKLTLFIPFIWLDSFIWNIFALSIFPHVHCYFILSQPCLAITYIYIFFFLNVIVISLQPRMSNVYASQYLQFQTSGLQIKLYNSLCSAKHFLLNWILFAIYQMYITH